MAETLSEKENDFLAERGYMSKFELDFICTKMREVVSGKLYVNARSKGMYPGNIKKFLMAKHSGELGAALLEHLKKVQAGPALILSIATVYPEHFLVLKKDRDTSGDITVIFQAEGADPPPQVCLC